MKRVILAVATSPGFYADRNCAQYLHTAIIARTGSAQLYRRDRKQALETIAG